VRATAERRGDTIRIACWCLPGGVDLVTTTRAGPWTREQHLWRWHRQGRTGHTSTCPLCRRVWALFGRWSGRGSLVLVQVPRLEPGTTLPADPVMAVVLAVVHRDRKPENVIA
jgi:hypothetical protein